MKHFLSLFMLMSLLLFSAPLFADAKTLPAGVYKFDSHFTTLGFEKVGVNPSGDKLTWTEKNLSDAVMSDLPSLTALNTLSGGALDLTTKLAKNWTKNKIYLDMGYGLTDELTVFINSSYEMATLEYTAEYVAQTAVIETVQGALTSGQVLLGGGTPAAAAAAATAATDAYNTAPNKATSSGLNDIYLGFKYRLMDNMAIASKFSASVLKIGRDSREITNSDGKQELTTGNSFDEYHFYGFYDLDTGVVPLSLMGGYIIKTVGYQDFLDNLAIDVDYGDFILLGINAPCSLTEELVIQPSLTYIISRGDTYRGGNSGHTDFTTVPESHVRTFLPKVSATYSPERFLRFYVEGSMPFQDVVKGQIYDSPGRAKTGAVITAGVSLFYK